MERNDITNPNSVVFDSHNGRPTLWMSNDHGYHAELNWMVNGYAGGEPEVWLNIELYIEDLFDFGWLARSAKWSGLTEFVSSLSDHHAKMKELNSDGSVAVEVGWCIGERDHENAVAEGFTLLEAKRQVIT